MTTGLVFDSSAVAKWFVEEDESREMHRIRDLYLSGSIHLCHKKQKTLVIYRFNDYNNIRF